MTLASLLKKAFKIVEENDLEAIEDVHFAVIAADDGTAKQAQINFIRDKIMARKALQS